MEILKETVPQVIFVKPTPQTTVQNVTYSYNGTTATLPTNSVVTSTDIVTAMLPYLPDEGTITVTWSFTVPGSPTGLTKTDTYKIVTPYLSHYWIKTNLLEGSTDDEIAGAEAAARFIVQAHTGQYFGKEHDTKRAWGGANNALILPARLLTLENINGITDSDFYLMADGWVLSRPSWSGIPPVKADFYGINEQTASYPPVRWPWSNSGGVFGGNSPYDITGYWGWESVPDAVVEAMKLLVNDYACGDAQYRDRFLTSMTAADWRIQFNASAFLDTGNVRANQLLEDYVVKRSWVAI